MIVFSVDSPAGFVSAVELAKGAFLPRYQLRCERATTAFGTDPAQQARRSLQRLLLCGDLTDCQCGGYRMQGAYLPAKDTVQLTVESDCFFTPDRALELHRRAAGLAEETARRAAALPGNDLARLIPAYQQTLQAHFVYRQTGTAADYSADHLVQSGFGVCQAFAALTLAVLPRLGIPCRCVSGTGGTVGDFDSHAWNLLLLPGRAPVHADFTFGLQQPFVPTTATALGRRAFCATHRWETDQEVLTGTVPRPHFRLCLGGRALRSGQVCVYNDRPFTLAERALLTTSPEAMTFERRRFAV